MHTMHDIRVANSKMWQITDFGNRLRAVYQVTTTMLQFTTYFGNVPGHWLQWLYTVILFQVKILAFVKRLSS